MFKTKVILSILVGLLALILPQTLLAQGGGVLEMQLQRALQQHPRIVRQRLQARSAQEGAALAARLYPDPRLMLERKRSSSRETTYYPSADYMEGSMRSNELRIEQEIPFPGKLSLDARRRALDAERETLRLSLEQNNLVGELLRTLVDYQRTEDGMRLARAFVDRGGLLAASARARYAGGQGLLADAASAQVRADSYRQRLTAIELEHAVHQEQLRYLLAAPTPAQTVEHDHDLDVAGLLAANQLPGLLAQVEERLPTDAAALRQRSIEAAIVRVDHVEGGVRRSRAWLDYLPDFAVFAGYERIRRQSDWLSLRRGTEQEYSVGVTIRVPLWSALSNHNQILSASAAEQAASSGAEDAELRVISAYRALQAERRSLREQATIYRSELLPRARAARDSAMLAYEAGRMEFVSVLALWEELFRFELEAIELRAREQSAVIAMAGLADVLIPENWLREGRENEP
ncbi:MAG: TolC family protein [Leptospirales bacterium]|nr:TolC family protein [Leptospirales bacterium]